MQEPAEEIVFNVADDASGDRLDRVLAAGVPGMSRSRLQALIRAGQVSVGGRTIGEPKYRVNSGELVVVTVPPPVSADPQPQAIPLNIVHEDEEVIVVEKRAGLVVHPGAGAPDGTLVNALLHHCAGSLSGIGGVERPGIVHRLDKDTSGLIVAAKTDHAHRDLSAQFADHGRTGVLERGYLALVWGAPGRPRGRIDAPLARSPLNPEKMAVRENGRVAVTNYELRRRFAAADGPALASQLECRLETGRTHQIRVHLAHLGYPLIGDSVYGAGFRSKANLLPPAARQALEALGRQALHAYLLQFRHPGTGAVLRFESDLPPDIAALMAALPGT